MIETLILTRFLATTPTPKTPILVSRISVITFLDVTQYGDCHVMLVSPDAAAVTPISSCHVSYVLAKSIKYDEQAAPVTCFDEHF